MKDAINRRKFLKQAGAAGLGLGLAGYFGSPSQTRAQTPAATGRTLGPNDQINAAVIGTNGRGMAHVDCLLALPGVAIAQICDVDDRAIAKAMKLWQSDYEPGWEPKVWRPSHNTTPSMKTIRTRACLSRTLPSFP